MTIQYVLTKSEYDDMQRSVHELNQIAFLTQRFAIETSMTTLDCVIALIELEQILTAKLKEVAQ